MQYQPFLLLCICNINHFCCSVYEISNMFVALSMQYQPFLLLCLCNINHVCALSMQYQPFSLLCLCNINHFCCSVYAISIIFVALYVQNHRHGQYKANLEFNNLSFICVAFVQLRSLLLSLVRLTIINIVRRVAMRRPGSMGFNIIWE